MEVLFTSKVWITLFDLGLEQAQERALKTKSAIGKVSWGLCVCISIVLYSHILLAESLDSPMFSFNLNGG